MAINSFRSMNQDFHQGSIDRTYIELTPNRGNVENPPVERLQWPTYAHANMFAESAHLEGHVRRSLHPHEIKTTGDGDTRF